MKIRSAPLDDVHAEAMLVLDDDGRRRARAARWAATALYRAHRAALLVLLRLRWRMHGGGIW